MIGIQVSIRARPHGRAMQKTRLPIFTGFTVSIRARPHGRAMLTYEKACE